MDCAVSAFIVAAIVLDNVEFLPAASFVWIWYLFVRHHPECIPGTGLRGEISPNFEIAVGLREVTLGGD
jgi:hypothetical protein